MYEMSKILVLCKRMDMGGTEMALLALLNKLLENNHQVSLLLTDKSGVLLNRVPSEVKVLELDFHNDIYNKLAEKNIDNVPFHNVKKAIAKVISLYYIKKGFFPALYEYLLTKIVPLDENYDVVLDFHSYGYFLTAFAAKKIDAKKKAIWFHDENVDWTNCTNVYFDCFDKMYCVSNSVKEALTNKYPSYSSKIEVLLNFIDTESIKTKANASLNDPDFKGNLKLVTVGRLVQQKGIDIAIKTAQILTQNSIDYQWYVIGDGEDRQALQSQIDALKLNDRFHLLGRKDNPYPYIANCDIYIQPSRHEGYGISLIEARVLCKPIIASDISSSREQISAEKNGILAALEPQKFAEQIIRLINDQSLADKLVSELKNEQIDFNSEYNKLDAFLKS